MSIPLSRSAARFWACSSRRHGRGVVVRVRRLGSWLRWIASAIRLIRCSRASQVAPTDGQLGDRPGELRLVHP